MRDFLVKFFVKLFVRVRSHRRGMCKMRRKRNSRVGPLRESVGAANLKNRNSIRSVKCAFNHAVRKIDNKTGKTGGTNECEKAMAKERGRVQRLRRV